MKSRIQELS
jgi:hypothetical protein